MATFLKRYFQYIFISLGLLFSFVGMTLIKRRLEMKPSSTYELLFFLFQIIFVGILSYVLLNWLFKKWKQYQVLKNEKTKAELANLKNQISPHFFFNTLNNLYGLVKKDSEKAQEFILKLSDLMRYSIYVSDDDLVDIKEEISFLENFIDLQKIRYYKKMDISFIHSVDDENIKIMPLLLIILLENAFKHGVEKLTEDIYVKAVLTINKKRLTFKVENNFDPETISETGIGLKNLEKRLQLIYSKKHRYTVNKDGTIYRTQLEILL